MDYKGGSDNKQRTRDLSKGLPKGDALWAGLFTVCLKHVAWKISATEGSRLSKPVSTKVTGLLYTDDFKVFAASESKLNWVLESVEESMEEPRQMCGCSCEKGSAYYECLGSEP